MGIYSDGQGHVTPQSVIRSSRISNSFKTVVRLTCKNEEDPIKIEEPRVVTIFYVDVSDAQGQIIL